MKLLPAPYGWGTFGSVLLRLRADPPLRAWQQPALVEQLSQHGCPPSIGRKVAACLSASGHYECCTWDHVGRGAAAAPAFRALGVEVTVLRYTRPDGEAHRPRSSQPFLRETHEYSPTERGYFRTVGICDPRRIDLGAVTLVLTDELHK